MLKLTALLSLALIAVVSSTRSACGSCGAECAPACGTRRFRACCFNYLRKKRVDHQMWKSDEENEGKTDQRMPLFIEYLPEDYMSNVASVKNYPDILANNPPV